MSRGPAFRAGRLNVARTGSMVSLCGRGVQAVADRSVGRGPHWNSSGVGAWGAGRRCAHVTLPGLQPGNRTRDGAGPGRPSVHVTLPGSWPGNRTRGAQAPARMRSGRARPADGESSMNACVLVWVHRHGIPFTSSPHSRPTDGSSTPWSWHPHRVGIEPAHATRPPDTDPHCSVRAIRPPGARPDCSASAMCLPGAWPDCSVSAICPPGA